MTEFELSTEDQLAVGQLYARQAHAIDSGDGPGWAASFTADGTFTSPTYDGPVTGADQLAAFAEAFAADGERAGVVRRHVTTALILEPLGADGATGRCYAMVLAIAPGQPPRIERCAVFRDELICADGRWRIRRREVRVDGRA